MQCFNCIQNVTKRHEKRRSSRRAWYKCHFVCIRYGVFRSSRITMESSTLMTGKGLSAVPMRYCFPSTVWMTKARCSRAGNCEVVEKESFTFSKVSLLSNCVSISQTASPICGIRKVSANTPTGASANAFYVMLAMSDEAST
mgnify:CR=1 FL=1